MMTAHELGCNFTEFSLEEKLKKKHQIFGFVCCVISYNRNHNHNFFSSHSLLLGHISV